jgi:Tfp pilus assembly protein PilO
MEYICGVAWLAIMVVLGSGYWLLVQDEQAEWEKQKKKTKK